MARLIYGMLMSLDGFIADARGDLTLPVPTGALHEHFNQRMAEVTGSIYGRRMYEMMRYWDEDQDEFGPVEHAFARAFRAKPKWVVSRTLKQLGPNASLIEGDLREAVSRIKAEHEGEIEVAGAETARALGEMGLIDEYWLYFQPVVLGGGVPYFAPGLGLTLSLIGVETLPQEVVLARYRRV